jgi:inner membrane protein YidH
MIERYSDHAANERTFLAWVRTAIAIMAFGFLVQKFDLFLRIAGDSLAKRSLPAGSSAGSSIIGTAAGLSLIVLGGVTMLFAAIRFRRTTLDIEAAELRSGPGTRLDITLVMLLLVLGAILFAYLVYTTAGWL